MGPCFPGGRERVEGYQVAPWVLFSVGHGRRSIDAFLALLRRAGVRRLVDVRVAPGSRRNPQFGQEALRTALEGAGIAYGWRKDLGGFRRPRPDSRHTALRNAMFQGYADHMDTPRFRESLDWLVETSVEVPTAFMCAESDWRRCHRRLIADALVAAGVRVIHLHDTGDEEHVLPPYARVEDDRPVYDAGQATLA
jgi:uncharacterized protein (DUF488 family)